MSFEAAYSPLAVQRHRAREQAHALAAAAIAETRGEPVHRELAERLHAMLGRQLEDDGLAELKRVVASHVAQDVPAPLRAAFSKAKAQPTFSNLQRLQREYDQHEESEAMSILLSTLED